MLIEVAMLAILIYRPSIWLAIWFGVLVAFRRVPWFANEIARMLALDEQVGMTLWAGRVLLPAWDGAQVVMSLGEDEPQIIAPQVVHVPVPNTGSSPDTNAIAPNDDGSRREQFLVIMADQKDERGGYLFSANQIHAAIGGHRATILARVRERRAASLPPLYRTDAGVVPASNPITRDPHGPT